MWMYPLLPSCCSFSFVLGCGVYFMVGSNVLLLMAVEQLLVIWLYCREWPVRDMSRGQIWLVSTFTSEQGSPRHQHRFHPKGLSNVDSGLGRRRKRKYKLLCVCICEVCMMCGVCVVYVWCMCMMCVWTVCVLCVWYVMCVCGVWVWHVCDVYVCCVCVCGMHVRCEMCVCMWCVCVWYVCVGCVMCVCDLCVCCVCTMCAMCVICVCVVCACVMSDLYVCDLCVCDVWCVCALSLYVFLSLSIPYGRGSSTYSKFICKCEKWNTLLAFHISFLFWPL